MTEVNELRLGELLNSKLCHDLISPIGAINNGLEFLEEDSSDMLEEATKLIKSSARQAADRLAYFRLALGAGGATGTVEFNTVLDLVEKLAVEKKVEIVWTDAEAYPHSNINIPISKLILNLALIAFDCLPRGGKIEISLANDTESPDITITISGEKCNFRDDVKTGLNSEISADSLTVRNVLAFYCVKLAINCQKTLKLRDEFPSLIVFGVS
jgi:histidine phosphotransferase ChpT